jgi:hypothetical protein
MRDYRSFAARIMQPERSRLALLWRGLGLPEPTPTSLDEIPPGYGAREAASLWESLAAEGHIPFSWIHDPERSFWGVPLYAEPTLSPPDLRSALAVALDVPGVLWAESLAQEAAQRLAVWGVRTQRPNICWCTGGSPDELWRRFSPARCALWGVAGVLPPEIAPELVVKRRGPASNPLDVVYELLYFAPTRWRSVASVAYHDALAELRWEKGIQRELRLRPSMVREARLPDALDWAELGSLPNPLPPLLDLWSLGYSLLDISRDCLFLVAP